MSVRVSNLFYRDTNTILLPDRDPSHNAFADCIKSLQTSKYCFGSLSFYFEIDSTRQIGIPKFSLQTKALQHDGQRRTNATIRQQECKSTAIREKAKLPLIIIILFPTKYHGKTRPPVMLRNWRTSSSFD